MIDIIKRNKLATLLVVAVLGYVLLGAAVRFFQAYRFQGEWALFDSHNYSQEEDFPEVRIKYPKSWETYIYEKRKIEEFRITFVEPNYFFFSNTELGVYWRRVDNSWTLEDTKNWFVENVPLGINRSELEQKQDSFQEITVGKGDYPALTQTFVQFSGANPRRQVVILVVGNQAFAFSFHTNNYDEETRQIFKRMLDTLEIYE